MEAVIHTMTRSGFERKKPLENRPLYIKLALLEVMTFSIKIHAHVAVSSSDYFSHFIDIGAAGPKIFAPIIFFIQNRRWNLS